MPTEAYAHGQIVPHVTEKGYIAILASFVNLLLPDRGLGEGWGGVKNLQLLQELLLINIKNRLKCYQNNF